MGLSRGLRNNNPLNIRHNQDVFSGEIESTDKSFKAFESMPYGYRAAFIILHTYQKRGWNTIAKMIAHWAPPAENNTEAYIKRVARYSGIRRNKVLTSTDGTDYIMIVSAMSFVENGVKAEIGDVQRGFHLQTRIKIEWKKISTLRLLQRYALSPAVALK